MGDFPPQRGTTLDYTHRPAWVDSPGVANTGVVLGAALTIGSITWVANLIIYIPIVLTRPYTVKRIWWVNGSTVTTSAAAFGIYTSDFTKIYATASTTQTGTSALQYVTPAANFTLPPGSYYYAWVSDNTTNRAYGSVSLTAARLRQSGVLQQAGSTTLGATGTPATVANALLPLCGISNTTSGF